MLEDWDSIEYTDVGTFLKKTAIILTNRIGGTSGPIWGTAFLRAGGALTGNRPSSRRGRRRRCCGPPSRASRSAATRTLGDKTLLDALVPAVDALEAAFAEGAAGGDRTRCGKAARERRGHEGHAGPARPGLVHRRAKPGSVDAGAMGIAVMFEAVSKAWQEAELERPALIGRRQTE